MKIKEINIKNFKSILDITIQNPNPFSVFVGPNASGKSNIFEALEIFEFIDKQKIDQQLFNIFGDFEDLTNKNQLNEKIVFNTLIEKEKKDSSFEVRIDKSGIIFTKSSVKAQELNQKLKNNELNYFSEFFNNYQRLFLTTTLLERQKYKTNKFLDFHASNLQLVLGRVLKDKNLREEVFDFMSLFVPGFEKIEIVKNELSGKEDIVLYEENYKKPFTGNLISDGTYNLLALITIVLQSEEPQFLLIEEPENGLNPKIVQELVGFFREKCQEKGHYIWLTSHSQSLVSELTQEELIIVDKINGETKIKQFKNINLHGLKLDEAWLSNVLDGGLPW